MLRPTTRCRARFSHHLLPRAFGSVAFLFFAISLPVDRISGVSAQPCGLRAQAADAWALAGAEVGVVFCTVVLTTGPFWGRRAWGIWWTWDARLTTTLVLWLIYVSYLLLRRFVAGPQVQTLAAVLGIFGALDVPIVYMSNRWWRTQHPAPVFGGADRLGHGPVDGRTVSVEHAGMVLLGHFYSDPALQRGAGAPGKITGAQDAQDSAGRLILGKDLSGTRRGKTMDQRSNSRSPVYCCSLCRYLGHPVGLSGLAGGEMAGAKAQRGAVEME